MILGKIPSQKGWEKLSRGVTIPGIIKKMYECGTWGHGLGVTTVVVLVDGWTGCS